MTDTTQATDAGAAGAVQTETAATTVTETTVKSEEAKAWDQFEAAEKPQGKAAPAETKTDVAETKTEGAASTEAAKPEKTETAQDIWASAPTELKTAYQKLQDDVNSALAQKKRSDGTVSGLMKKIAKLEGELKGKAAPSGAATQETKAPDSPGFFDSAEWKAFKEDYPELAAKQEAAFKPLLGAVEMVRKDVDGINRERSDTQISENYAAVVKDHADYPEIKGSPAFLEWYHGLDTEDLIEGALAQAVKDNADVIVNPKKVTKLLKAFKDWQAKSAESTGSGKGQQTAEGQTTDGNSQTQAREPTRAETRREAQLESSASPRTQGLGAVTDAAPNDPAQAWAYFERKGL